MSLSPQPLSIIHLTNHQKRFVLRRPSSNEVARDIILEQARNKLRIKALSTVYLQGGTLLLDGGIPEWVQKVYVGKETDIYNGPPPNLQQSEDPGEYRVIGAKSYIDVEAVKQLRAVSALPGVKLAVGFPDLHCGNRWPVGISVVAEGVYPALIGGDIGCGIAVYDISRGRKGIPTAPKVANMLRGVDRPWEGDTKAWLTQHGIEKETSFDKESLGTVGLGNHFAEICLVEKIIYEEAAERLGMHEGGLYLLVHTGSRGLGGKILASQTANEANPYHPHDSALLAPYLEEHDHAVHWAIANRDLVAYRIEQCLFPASDGESPKPPRKIIDVTHNSVTKHPFGEESKEMWVHRKGAAPADKGVAPCPGSRGDFSWLLEPTTDGWERHGFSLAHGAGRRYARAAMHTGSKINKASLTTTSLGSEVICMNPDLLVEERPEAYKEVACVVEDMEEAGMCKGVVKLRPYVTFKTREGGDRTRE